MEHTHIGAYGLIIKDHKILLVEKHGGPYDGQLDLPGGSFHFNERPIDALKRELKEETGIDLIKCELFDCDSVTAKWVREDGIVTVHHIGIFYKVLDYSGTILENINLDDINEDSSGARWYDINNLHENEISLITSLELKKLNL